MVVLENKEESWQCASEFLDGGGFDRWIEQETPYCITNQFRRGGLDVLLQFRLLI